MLFPRAFLLVSSVIASGILASASFPGTSALANGWRDQGHDFRGQHQPSQTTKALTKAPGRLVQPVLQSGHVLPNRAALNYFSEVAFTGEFSNVVPMIRKWEEDIRIRIHGHPSAEDLKTLEAVVAELNALIEDVSIHWVTDRGSVANFEIFFVPESQFSRYEPSYRPRNYGFFWAWSDRRGRLRRAKVLISTDAINQRERSHLIREELTQSLGLMQDSFRYTDSIFYQNWTTTTQFSPLDQQLIKMLYRSDILPGMNQRQALQVLQSQ